MLFLITVVGYFCLCMWLVYENWKLRDRINILNCANFNWHKAYKEQWEKIHELKLQLKEEKGHSIFYRNQLNEIESVLAKYKGDQG